MLITRPPSLACVLHSFNIGKYIGGRRASRDKTLAGKSLLRTDTVHAMSLSELVVDADIVAAKPAAIGRLDAEQGFRQPGGSQIGPMRRQRGDGGSRVHTDPRTRCGV